MKIHVKQMSEEISGTNDEKELQKPNFIVRVLSLVFGFGIFVCCTYIACLTVVSMLVAAVALAIIYGVCHSVLEIARIISKQKTGRESPPVKN